MIINKHDDKYDLASELFKHKSESKYIKLNVSINTLANFILTGKFGFITDVCDKLENLIRHENDRATEWLDVSSSSDSGIKAITETIKSYHQEVLFVKYGQDIMQELILSCLIDVDESLQFHEKIFNEAINSNVYAINFIYAISNKRYADSQMKDLLSNKLLNNLNDFIDMLISFKNNLKEAKIHNDYLDKLGELISYNYSENICKDEKFNNKLSSLKINKEDRKLINKLIIAIDKNYYPIRREVNNSLF